MPDYDTYVICTSPRSGSTLLCKLLAETGIAGNPDSYFHRPSVARWLEHFNLTPAASSSECVALREIVKAAIAEGSLDTGIFGLRLQRHSFDYFVKKMAVLHAELSSDVQRFQQAFGRTAFIHLTRCDKVEQAVSYVKAEQSGLWHRSLDGTELERLSPPQPLCYSAESIRARVGEFTDYDTQWETWFDTENIDPIRVTYEALSADPRQTLCKILNQLGLDGHAAAHIEPSIAKLADQISHEWVSRYRVDYPGV